DVVVYVDQDNLVTDRAWLRSLVAPFTEDPELEVVQGLLHVVPGDALTNRYLSAIGIEDPFAAHRSLVTQSLVRPGRFERGRRHLALALDPRRVLYGGNNGCAWRRATLEGL